MLRDWPTAPAVPEPEPDAAAAAAEQPALWDFIEYTR